MDAKEMLLAKLGELGLPPPKQLVGRVIMTLFRLDDAGGGNLVVSAVSGLELDPTTQDLVLHLAMTGSNGQTYIVSHGREGWTDEDDHPASPPELL